VNAHFVESSSELVKAERIVKVFRTIGVYREYTLVPETKAVILLTFELRAQDVWC
jgi:hypothetical protein